jgi:hypothetical protein
MKKIYSILTVALIVLVSSCDKLNEMPEFNDGDAFVAFNKTTMSVNEDGSTLSIPVTLASVSGISANVTYTVTDGTAKLGENFTLADASATLSFDATNRTRDIVINIINKPGVYTGDLKFTIQLSGAGAVKPSAEGTCTVTIADIDHPLSAILATYNASADSYFASRGHFDWSIKIEKDENDVSVVWISNLDPYFAKYGYVAPNYNYFYGVVNDDLTKITIPTGQNMGYNETTTLEGFDHSDPDQGAKTTNIIMEIKDGGATISIPNAWGVYSGTGWYNLFYGGITFTKSTK